MTAAFLAERVWVLGAVLLWASSSLIVSRGMSGLRDHAGIQGRIRPREVFSDVLVSILLATGSGAAALALVSGFGVQFVLDFRVVAAGLLTFPVGTGLYYMAALSFRDRADVAAQFSNVKPLVSILLAFLVFQEAAGPSDVAALTVIALAVVLLTVAAASDSAGQGWAPLLLGLSLAAAWAGGEALVKAAAVEVRAIDIAFTGLLASTAALIAVLIFAAGWRAFHAEGGGRMLLPGGYFPGRRHVPFLLHGVLSFGFAYALFFQSISTLGLARSVMVSSLWPPLAFVIGSLSRRRRGVESPPVSRLRAAGFSLLPVGALISVFG